MSPQRAPTSRLWRSGVALAVLALTAGAAPGGRAHADEAPDAHVFDSPVPGPERVQFAVPFTDDRISVDGRLDEPGWEVAARIALGFEVAPRENAAAPVETECRLLHDSNHLYVSCTARDPAPEQIRAHLVDRDRIAGHDRVAITLDPFNDSRRAFRFVVSAVGIQSDAIVSQQVGGGGGTTSVDLTWDAIWSSGGRITDEGYTVEAAIPFRSLRFPPDPAAGNWGVFLSRWWPRGAEVELRSAARDRDNSCVLCQSDELTGIRPGRPAIDVEVAPTATVSRTDSRSEFPDGELRAGPADRDVGLGLRWGVTSGVSVDVTANPDFSQVEADVPQLEINERFALFFPEKRPFFLEGADFFNTTIPAVFTRSIVDPSVGGKVTGKVAKYAMGFLAARDRSNRLTIPGSEFSQAGAIDGGATSVVARLRRDVGSSSTIGGLFTSRDGEQYSNRVGGIDVLLRPLAPVTLEAQLLYSTTSYPEALASSTEQPTDDFSGYAFQGSAFLSTTDWLANVNVRSFDPGFRADAGFLSQVGIRRGEVSVTRQWWGGEGRWFDRLAFTGGGWKTEDFGNATLDDGLWLGAQFRGLGQTSIEVWPSLFMQRRFAGIDFHDMHNVYAFVQSAPWGSLSLGLTAMRGDAIDFENRRLGHETRWEPMVTARLSTHLEGTLQHAFRRLEHGSARVFTAYLTDARLAYYFSPRSFLRVTGQYQRVLRSPAEYVAGPVDREERSVFLKVLYSFKLNPLTLVFLGYSTDGAGLAGLDSGQVPISTTSRTFFMKLGYAWRPG